MWEERNDQMILFFATFGWWQWWSVYSCDDSDDSDDSDFVPTFWYTYINMLYTHPFFSFQHFWQYSTSLNFQTLARLFVVFNLNNNCIYSIFDVFSQRLLMELCGDSPPASLCRVAPLVHESARLAWSVLRRCMTVHRKSRRQYARLTRLQSQQTDTVTQLHVGCNAPEEQHDPALLRLWRFGSIVWRRYPAFLWLRRA